MEAEDQEQKNFVLECGGQKFELDHKFKDISELANFTHSQWGSDEDEFVVIKIDQTIVDPEILKKIVQWIKDHNYNLPDIQNVKSSSLEKVLNNDKIDVEFAKNLDYLKPDALMKFQEAAKYLQIEQLKKLISARVATEFFYKNNDQFEQILKKLDVKEDISIEQEEELYKENKWVLDY